MPDYPSRSAEGDAAGWPTLLRDIARAGRRLPAPDQVLADAAVLLAERLPAANCRVLQVTSIGRDSVWLAMGGVPAEAHPGDHGAGRAALHRQVVFEAPGGGRHDAFIPVARGGRAFAVLALTSVGVPPGAPGLAAILEAVRLQLGTLVDRRSAEGSYGEVDPEFLQALIDALPVGLFFFDVDTRCILDINSHAQTEFGLRRDEVRGKTLAQVFDGPNALSATDAMTRALAGAAAVESHMVLKDNGRRRILHLRHVVLRRPDGHARWLIALARDITRERGNERDLQAAREALEAASQAKSQFMANMSHEMRTPMNGVLGMTELLLGTALSDAQRRFAQAVYRSGESLLELINDILDFSKIEAGRLAFSPCDFVVRTVVEDTLELLAPRAHEKGLELSFRETDDLPTVLNGDPLWLRQVLTNLIANAIKFTDQGEVSVQVRRRPGAADNVLEFVVRDTGIGIEVETLPRLFDAFMQGSVGLARRYGGTGLGLPVSKHLIEWMGGAIEVQSWPGQGSQFVFTLPFGVAERAGDPQESDRVSMPALRVLVVDDLETNRVMLDDMLRAWGMDVVVAVDGRHAHDILTGGTAIEPHFDLAVVDMHMPRMNGLALARAVRADGRHPDLKMVLLSSATTDRDVLVAYEAGYDRFLAKPVRKTELRQALLALSAGRPDAPRLTPRLNAHILVVEDNAVNQEVIGQMLRVLGCRVQVCSSGLSGLRALCEARFDLVLMDIQMPGMDGIEALGRFRRGKTRRFLFVTPRTTPVIAVTANALEGDEERFLGLGFDGYLSKPFRQRQLLAMLIQHIRPTAPAESEQSTGSPSAAEASTGSEGVLDTQALDRLRELDPTGENRLMERVVSAFETSVARLMPQLQEALQANELSGIRHVSHTLKSSSASMGAVKLSKMCSEVENMARQGQSDGMNERVALLQAEVEIVRVALKHVLNA